ncbi:hypothetical protein [Adlercreutzia sp. ZJ141]|uniref:hypothetical protein n=1 Tax=Adlercreutzia sp. ZJ141 TaxID=2709406 RepID=UPI0013EB46BE|nr:hypothetical protein [Adlercreutzia sp. ZJ141]
MEQNVDKDSPEVEGAKSVDKLGKLGKLGQAFGDLSFSQVVAAALAAMTSLLLSSSIGIAGSIIGAAVGSVVATVSTQLYKNALAASAEKLRDIPVIVQNVAGSTHAEAPLDGSHTTADGDADAGARSDAYSGKRSVDCDDESCAVRDVLAFDSKDDHKGTASETEGESEAETSTHKGVQTSEHAIQDVKDQADLDMTHVSSFAASHDATLVAHARADRARRQMKIRAFVVGVVASLLAVAAVAIIVNVATAGNGLGAKPEPARWMPSASQKATAPDTSAQDPAATADKNESQNGEATPDDQKSQEGATPDSGNKDDQDSPDETGAAPEPGTDDGSGNASGSGDSTGSGSGSPVSPGDTGGSDGSSSGGSSSGSSGSSGTTKPGTTKPGSSAP